MKRLFAALLVALMLFSPALAEEEEDSFLSFVSVPSVTVHAPAIGQSYDKGGVLRVSASGKNVTRMELTFTYEGVSLTVTQEGDTIEHTFDTYQFTKCAVVTVTGYGAPDKYGYETAATQSVSVLAPREKLFRDMFALAYKNFKDPYYYHAPAQEDSDRGICKNFVMRMFDTFKDAYAMKEYPDLPLHMPKNNSKVNCQPYDYGIEWRIESAEDGSPFEIVGSFRYDTSLSKEENQAACLAVLQSVQAGDFFQMTGDYYYGKGAHSLLFIADYDPVSGEVHWTDSNMLNDTVDGYHYGYMQYDASRPAQWFVDAVCYKNHGCTLYRLRDDFFIK